MEVIKTGKLHAYIGPDNYIYTRSSARRNVTYYSCRKKDCLGRANVRNDVFKTTEPHGHPVDLEQVKKFRFRHRLQQRAAEETLSIAEIYKQEASAIGGVPGVKLKSVNRGMYRARHGELPPPPKSINELATLLVDEKWKEKMLYSYGEEREEFFKACLQSEDSSTQVIFMSPTFEDFARTGAPLRLHMDSAFKIKPACGEGTEYVALHMYIGTILYPFVHMFTSLKSYYAYFSLMKYISDFIPNLNVEIFVSNDQESIEAAYTVFPKAVKSYYQPREKDKDNTSHKKETDLSDVELFNKEFTRRLWPKPGVWRFLETLKEIDYNKMSDFYRLRLKRVPNRYPVKKREVEVQTDQQNQQKIKVNSESQTIPPKNIKEYFSEFKPFLSQLAPLKGKGRRGYLSSSTHNQKRSLLISKSSKNADLKKIRQPIVIKKIIKTEHSYDSPKKLPTDENIVLRTVKSESKPIEVLIDPESLNQSSNQKPIILRRAPKVKSSMTDVDSLQIENSQSAVIINKPIKFVKIDSIETSPPKGSPPVKKLKRKEMEVIEQQLAEMEGAEILEEEVKHVEKKRGRKRKYPRPEDNVLKNTESEIVLELDVNEHNTEEWNSDDGEIEMLELDEEIYEEHTTEGALEESSDPLHEEGDLNESNEETIRKTERTIDESQETIDETQETLDETHETIDDVEATIHDAQETLDDSQETVDETQEVIDEGQETMEEIQDSVEDNAQEEMDSTPLEGKSHLDIITVSSLADLAVEQNESIQVLYEEAGETSSVLTDDQNHTT